MKAFKCNEEETVGHASKLEYGTTSNVFAFATKVLQQRLQILG
jgi:hypothetical protein